jgi:hypothetical protein
MLSKALGLNAFPGCKNCKACEKKYFKKLLVNFLIFGHKKFRFEPTYRKVSSFRFGFMYPDLQH